MYWQMDKCTITSARVLRASHLPSECRDACLAFFAPTGSGLGAAERRALAASTSGVLVLDLLCLLISLSEADKAGEERPDPLPAAETRKYCHEERAAKEGDKIVVCGGCLLHRPQPMKLAPKSRCPMKNY